MKLQYILLFFLVGFFATRATAQDIIKMKDSSAIKARVRQVTAKEIFYNKIDSLNNPQLIVSRKKVQCIYYESGTVSIIDTKSPLQHKVNVWMGAPKNPVYGKNIFSLSFHTSEESYGNTESLQTGLNGLGVWYERIMGEGKWSICLPFTLSLYSIYGERYDHGGPNKPAVDFTTKTGTHGFFTMYPGVQFYPNGNNHRFTYSYGPELALSYGRKYSTELAYDSINNIYTSLDVNKRVFRAGLLLSTTGNCMINRTIYVGMTAGVGYSFINNDYSYYEDDENQLTNDRALLLQFDFKVGYRF